MILFNQVTKKNDDKSILKDVSFSIGQGEFVFIYNDEQLTLMKLGQLLTGTETPDYGMVRILNNPGKMILNSEIGMVYRDNILLPGRSLFENLKFILEVKGLNYAYYQVRIKKILKLLGLEPYTDYLPGALLDHQLVKANIAQAMIAYPSLLVLDDCTYKLDEVNTQAIFHLIKEINARGITVIFLSSDFNFVFRNHLRTIYIKEGEKLGEFKKGYYA